MSIGSQGNLEAEEEKIEAGESASDQNQNIYRSKIDMAYEDR